MQYHVAIVGHNESVTVHAELVWQRKLADVVDRHIRAGNAKQRVTRRICHVVAIALAIEHRCAYGSQQPIFLPGGGVQSRRIFLNVLAFVQLRRAIKRMKNSFDDNILSPSQYSLRGANSSLGWNKSEGPRYLIHSRSLQCRSI